MHTLHPYLQAALGGLLIGLASWLLLAALGRVAGISGITAALLPSGAPPAATEQRWRAAFVAGLVIAGGAMAAWWPTPSTALRPWPLLAIAGLLVGFGTVLGSGCTSGHGVCGLGRRSARSLAATLCFMATGFATATLRALWA
ncbi:MAG: YeeE/YedE family protein [Curvibacter sp.]|nr:YeeE/YedE family protein [Curvibacter sp.]